MTPVGKPKPVTFTVLACPKPKGPRSDSSISETGRIIITSTNKGLKAWEQVISYAAQEHARQYLGAGYAVALTLAFYLPRPKRPKSPYPITRPDLDKLARAAKDSLSRVLYGDDGQVCDLTAKKRYAEPGEPPHCVITLEPIA